MPVEQVILALQLLLDAYFDSKTLTQEEIDFLRKVKEIFKEIR